MSVLGYLKDIFKRPALYSKFWISFGTAVLSTLTVLIPDSPYLTIIIVFVGSFGVWGVPNKK